MPLFKKKTALVNFWATIENFGLLLIPTSGHTVLANLSSGAKFKIDFSDRTSDDTWKLCKQYFNRLVMLEANALANPVNPLRSCRVVPK